MPVNLNTLGRDMTPGSFDHETSREIVGDAFARDLEAKARNDADAGTYDPPETKYGTYWDEVQGYMLRVVYDVQYGKRIRRNERV